MWATPALRTGIGANCGMDSAGFGSVGQSSPTQDYLRVDCATTKMINPLFN